VIVESIPFEIIPEEKPGIDIMSILYTILKYLIPLVIAFLVIIFVIKPMLELLKKPLEQKLIKREIVVGEEALESAPPVKEEKDLREEITNMVKTNPKKVVALLREWMAE